MSISAVLQVWMKEVEKIYDGDEQDQKLMTELTIDPSAHYDYTLNQGMLSYKGVRTLRKQI